MDKSRRNFLKGSVAVGTLASLNLNANQIAANMANGGEKFVCSICEMCSSRCAITAKIVNKKGYIRAPHRSLLRATGLKDDDFKKPFIGVCNSFAEIIPGHFFLNKFAKIIKDEIRKNVCMRARRKRF